MLQHLRRALELAVRYDYEYWVQREVANQPDLFALEEAAELLPSDVREQLAKLSTQAPSPVAQVVAEIPLESKSLTDLTINMLGPVEIFRDTARPPAPDA